MLRSVIIAVALAWSPPPEAPAPDAKRVELADLSGYYSCTGEDAAGKPYSGVCSILRRGDVYVVTWTVGSGQGFGGIGLRTGNSFSVGWALPSGESGLLIRGINTYTIHPATRRLAGRWGTVPGKTSTGTESLEWLKDHPEP